MKFTCKSCGILISESVTKLVDLGLVNHEQSGEPYFPKGYYHLYDEQTMKRMKLTKSNYLINITDLINTKNHTNLSRLNGCCGLDGMDGINKLCINGHEVATQFSDCWTMHYVELDAECVDIVEE